MNVVMKTFETRSINYTKKEHGVDFVGFADFYTDGQLRYAMNVRLANTVIDGGVWRLTVPAGRHG